MNWPFGKFRTIKCPNGNKVYVYKNIDDVFPLFAKDWLAKFNMAVDGLTKLQGSLGGEIGLHLSGFFVLINEKNASLQFNCRAAYCVYVINPCEHGIWLRDRIQEIMNHDDIRNRILIEINRIDSLIRSGAKPEELAKVIDEAKESLSKSVVANQTSQIFKDIPKDISSWKEERR